MMRDSSPIERGRLADKLTRRQLVEFDAVERCEPTPDRLGQVGPTFLRLGLASRPLSTSPTRGTVGLLRDLRGFLRLI
jgi:hypothetical protein